MPELPEVELVVRDLISELLGKGIIGTNVFWQGYVEGLPAEELSGCLSGQRFRRFERRGKYILMHLDDSALLSHLRMTGKIRILPTGGDFDGHTHVVIHLDNGCDLCFSDVRKFGRIRIFSLEETEMHLSALKLGIEPFGEEFKGERLASLFCARRRSIKNTLLDQSIIAGIGNIYASEILFAAGIDPFRPAGGLVRNEIAQLVRATRKVLRRAIERGGSSISDYMHVDGRRGEMQDDFKVYARAEERCFRCKGRIRRDVQGGRSTFWCPSCQR